MLSRAACVGCRAVSLWALSASLLLPPGARAVHQRTPAAVEPQSGTAGGGKLFFLFLAGDGLYQPGVWSDFFRGGRAGEDYEVLVHCHKNCTGDVAKHIEGALVVPTVESSYCKDLVNPMLALLRRALQVRPSAFPSADKFLLVSHSHVPVKPLSYILNALRQDGDTSLFCMGCQVKVNKGEWQDCVWQASQWFVLTRADSDRALQYNEKHSHEWAWIPLCADEQYFVNALFGFGCPNLLDGTTPGFKAMCTTYTVAMDHAASSRMAHLEKCSREDGLNANSRPFGPLVYSRLRPEFLHTMRSSTYFFMRKVPEEVTMLEGDMTFREAMATYVLK